MRTFLLPPVIATLVSEWFTVASNATYRVTRGSKTETMTGAALRDGIVMDLTAGESVSIRIQESNR